MSLARLLSSPWGGVLVGRRRQFCSVFALVSFQDCGEEGCSRVQFAVRRKVGKGGGKGGKGDEGAGEVAYNFLPAGPGAMHEGFMEVLFFQDEPGRETCGLRLDRACVEEQSSAADDGAWYQVDGVCCSELSAGTIDADAAPTERHHGGW